MISGENREKVNFIGIQNGIFLRRWIKPLLFGGILTAAVVWEEIKKQLLAGEKYETTIVWGEI